MRGAELSGIRPEEIKSQEITRSPARHARSPAQEGELELIQPEMVGFRDLWAPQESTANFMPVTAEGVGGTPQTTEAKPQRPVMSASGPLMGDISGFP